MNFESYQAVGENYTRAQALLREAERFAGCANIIEDNFSGEDADIRGKHFLEARRPDGHLCGIAIYDLTNPAELLIDLLCSDCKGTGTLMMTELSRIARENSKPILKLFSLPTATGFYTKLGFTLSPGEEMRDWGQYMQKAAGRRKTYRRRKHRRHGSASLRRHTSRRVL